MRYLVETDWAVYYLRGHQGIVDKIKSYRPSGLAISIITLAELQAGVHYGNDPARAKEGLDNFLSTVKALPITEDICEHYGREYARLRQLDQLIGEFDLLIAVTGLHYNLILLTNNEDHFKRVPGLKVESFQ